MPNLKQVLVTGGAGYIGSHTVISLVNAGYQPVILDNFSNSATQVIDNLQEIVQRPITCYHGDCRDTNLVSSIFQDHQLNGVIHFAASKAVGESVEKPLQYYGNNLDSLMVILNAMEEFKVYNLVFSSSCTVYGQPDQLPVTEHTERKPAASPYGNTKKICEDIIIDVVHGASDLKAISLRYFNPIGAHSTAKIGELPLGTPSNLVPFVSQTAAGIREILTVFGDDYNTPDGTCIRDYIHVMDLAEAHVRSLAYLDEQPENSFYDVFNIGTGKGASVMEVIKTFEEVSGVPVNFAVGARRSGDIEQIFANVEKADEVLKWKASNSMKQALADTWNWQQALSQDNLMTGKTILITGGAGFIGSHVVRKFVLKYPDYHIINLDKLTYAGNLENLKDVEKLDNYQFIKGDIEDIELLEDIFIKHPIKGIVHLAAESHVDRSISDPLSFIHTNILGTVNLLNVAVRHWKSLSDGLFYHVSTDEVYGSVEEPDLFTESTGYDPQSPYSASKASSDHFVRAYQNTYQLPVIITNCSNNYGPCQFPEKLIPLCIHNIKNSKPLPVYGTGENIRDWLYVEDHASAIDLIFHHGKQGETYNIGGNNQWKNIDLIRLLCTIIDHKLGRSDSENLITFVKDRPGHDARYAIDASKIQGQLGWEPSVELAEGLEKTVDWYLENEDWLEHVTSGQYQKYYQEQYSNR